MNGLDILTLAASIVIPLGGFLAWIYGRIDKKFEKIDERFNKIDERFNGIEKEVAQLNTRAAVMESKLTDLSTNITYLMWQHQTPPAKCYIY